MRASPFEGQLERLARTLTEQFGVTVLCQGDCACTDGRRILLPSLPEPMDDALERMVVDGTRQTRGSAATDHEMGHVAFSDFKVLKEFSEKHPGAEELLNVVEDALVERRWPALWRDSETLARRARPGRRIDIFVNAHRHPGGNRRGHGLSPTPCESSR